MNDILAFTLVALLLVISPGPNGALILKTIAKNPKSSALINLFGIACATFIHGGLSIFGLSALVLQSAELFITIKLLGAAYLFYIGFKALRSSFHKTSTTIINEQEVLIKLEKRTFISCFNEGFLTQLLNPKVSMFYLAAFPQFIGFDQSHIATAFGFVAIHAFLIVSWFILVIVLVDKLKNLQKEKGTWLNRWIQRLSGSVMIYFSLLIALQR
ncbi:LysE family translocator [Psychromonas sp. RZ22]|uniref:LysE family translocator n=1 Tax=Psychromonas algarum TaxID=2555643 RepID=UPI00106781DC|nr:LysE family translocator [Psychromonas sp. RZ22]TEW53728.1 LysE family translocator [Psychromonas sp. RZ22]